MIKPTPEVVEKLYLRECLDWLVFVGAITSQNKQHFWEELCELCMAANGTFFVDDFSDWDGPVPSAIRKHWGGKYYQWSVCW